MMVLVTGGGGFLGGAILRRLVDRGDRVRSLSRHHYPELTPLGVEQQQGDLADAGAVDRAVAGCELVFHVAAKAGIWGPRSEFEEINIRGTENVLSACRRHTVRRLVFTSSPSVVFNGSDQEGIDESTPYPAHYEADYPRTKAEAERAVLAANGPQLATVALRPHLIWGPRDNHLVPRIIVRARAGRLRRVGRACKLIDSTYIDNAADAHLLAADRLAPTSLIAGKVYFISNGEPLPLWDLVDRILAVAGMAPIRRRVPFCIAYAAGWFFERAYSARLRRGEPPMTRFLARELATAHWFNLTAARRDFGYVPNVSIEKGLVELKNWLHRTGDRT
jgi:nucleoside-diphosphate-sugar epimerase